jgi:tetratricopeptide (TPR) repeat protein
MSLYEKALLLVRQNQYALAIQELRRALALSPDHHSHALLAYCLGQQQRYPEAMTAAKTAIELAPQQPEGYCAYAGVLLALQNLTTAQEAIDQALALNPKEVKYYHLWAEIQCQRGNYHQTLIAAERGLAVDADYVPCQEIRLIALFYLHPTQYVQIQSEVEQVLVNHPDSFIAYSVYGWSCLYEFRVVEAAESFRQALQLSPNYDWAQRGLNEALKCI